MLGILKRTALVSTAAIALAGTSLIGSASATARVPQGSAETTTSAQAVISPLPDGGTLYTYNLPDGQVETIPVPPASFNPLTATASQLAEYDFPARPTDETALSQWETAMSALKGESTPPTTLQVPSDAPSQDACGADAGYACGWGGWYAGTAGSGTTYKAIDGQNRAPDVTNNGTCTEGSDTIAGSIWVGLGGAVRSGSDLVQQGIVFCAGPGRIEPRWWPFMEFTPAAETWFCNDPNDNGMFIPEGDVVLNNLTYGPLTNQATLYIEDVTAGTHLNCQISAPSGFVYDGSTADWITEQDAGYALPDYNTFQTVDAQAQYASNGSWNSLGNMTHNRVITGCPTSYTQLPQAIESDQQSFYMDWVQYTYSCS